MAGRSMLALLACMLYIGASYGATTITPVVDYDPSPSGKTTDYKFTVTSEGALTPKWRVDNGATEYFVTMGADPDGTADVTIGAEAGAFLAGPHCIQVKDNSEATWEEGAIYCWTVETFTKESGCTFTYSLNAAPDVTTTNDNSDTMTAFIEGSNVVTVTAYDTYGHASTPKTFSWDVDSTGPTVKMTSAGKDAAGVVDMVTDTSRYFAFTSPSDVTLTMFKYTINGGAVMELTGAAGTGEFIGTFPVNGCTSTPYTFSVYAVDLLGNSGDATSYSFVVEPIDTTVTLTNAVLGTMNALPASNGIFALAASGPVAAKSYEYSLDGATYVKTTATTVTFADLDEGSHTLLVRAIDTNGCVDPSPMSLIFSVDSTAPVTMVDALACPDTMFNHASTTIYGTVVDDNVMTTGTKYKLGADGAVWSVPVPCVGCPANTFMVSIHNMVDGEYTLMVMSEDTLGHMENWNAVCTWTVDSSLVPVNTVVVSGPPSPMPLTDSARFVFGEASGKPSVFFYSVNNSPYESVDGNMLTLTDLPSGIHTLKAYATDAAGNVDVDAVAYTWSVYDDHTYAQYMAVAGFKTVESTPLTYKPKDVMYVHTEL